MMMTIASLALAVLAAGGHTDTTLSVRRGARLDVNNFSGDIVVRTWSRDAVRIVASHSHRTYVRVDGSASRLEVTSENRRGMPTSVDFEFIVPEWMPVELAGIAADITVDGLKSEIKVQTVKGDVRVRGGSGYVSLGSVEGEVILSDARGRVQVSSVNQGIEVTNVSGEVRAETVNGDIVLERLDATHVEAATVNGGLFYVGSFQDDGVYTFSTHNGDIIVGVPERANLEVSVSTFGGDFESSFPLRFREARKGKRFSFTLGSGSARLDLEAFQGRIELKRPEAALKRARMKKTYDHGQDPNIDVDVDPDPEADPDPPEEGR